MIDRWTCSENRSEARSEGGERLCSLQLVCKQPFTDRSPIAVPRRAVGGADENEAGTAYTLPPGVVLKLDPLVGSEQSGYAMGCSPYPCRVTRSICRC